MWLAIDPFEDYPPLVVDADRMKVLSSCLLAFQAVRRRDHQVLEPARRVKRLKFALSRTHDTFELAHMLIPEQSLGPLVPERSDHNMTIPDTGMRSSRGAFLRRAPRSAARRNPGVRWTGAHGRRRQSPDPIHISVAFVAGPRTGRLGAPR